MEDRHDCSPGEREEDIFEEPTVPNPGSPEVQEVARETASLVEQAQAIEVRTLDEAQKATGLLSQIATAKRRSEINGHFKQFAEPLAEADTLVRGKVLAYERESREAELAAKSAPVTVASATAALASCELTDMEDRHDCSPGEREENIFEEPTAPNPGSPEAVEQGCSCPVLDNAHGAGIGNGSFVFAAGCPLHRAEIERVTESRRKRERELGEAA
jgi:hypothetical protein